MCVALLCGLAAPASAQLISISNTANLGFGQAFKSSSAGTVVMTAAGARSATGGVTLGSAASASAASFTVGGLPLFTYSISLPGSSSISAGGSSMTVDTFTSSPSGTGQLSAIGTQTLRIGATLRVGASQTSGSYSGTFSVTVVYN